MELEAVIQNKLNAKLAMGTERVTTLIGNLQRDLNGLHDYVVPFRRNDDGDVTFTSNGTLKMKLGENGTFEVHPHAVGQLGTNLDIPTAYLRTLANGTPEQKELASITLNRHKNWMKDNKRFLIRSVNHEVRGVLSDTYKRLDNKLLLNSFFREIENSGAQYADAHMTDVKFWIEALIPQIIPIPTEKNGMVFMAFGVRLTNSDYGDGALDLRSFMLQPVCQNGMVRESLMRKVHLGSRLDDNLSLSTKTYALESETTASLVTDITRGALNTGTIRESIGLIQAAAGTVVDLNREFLSLATKQVTKNEIVEIKSIMSQNNPEDGLSGEATLFKLSQGISALGRNVGERREREFAQIAGELLERAKEKK